MAHVALSLFNYKRLPLRIKLGGRLAVTGRPPFFMPDYRIILLHHLNWVDCVASLMSLSFGVEEANPAMRSAYDHDPSVFVVVKMVVAAIAIEILDRRLDRHRGWVLTALVALFSSVAIWHLFGLINSH